MKFRDLIPPSIWVEEELMATITAEIKKEMDEEILEKLRKFAAPMFPEVKQK